MNTVMVNHHRFIAHLEKLVMEKDRGALAALRHGLGKPPGMVREMDRYILCDLPPEVTGEQEDVYYLVGALFADWYQGENGLHPFEGNHESNETSNREDVKKRVEKRLVALLHCHRDDLPNHLRNTIGLLKSKDIPVNWTKLLCDVQNWQSESRYVQRNWARSFWRSDYSKETVPDETPSQNEEDKEEE